MQQRCIIREIIGRPVELGVSIITAIIFLTLGLTLGPYKVSISTILLLLIYVILQNTRTSIRLIPLIAATTLHIGAILTYYSNPIILPLTIIERSIDGKYSINIDIIQLAIIYEARQQLKNPPKCTQEQPEKTKTPEQPTQETGPQAAVV